MKAVVFDLWDTLVEWPVAEAEVLKARIAELVPHGRDEFERRWLEGYRVSQTGPLADAYRALGLPDEHVDEHVAARHEFARDVLRLRAGARDTLVRLRSHGIKLGMISVCSEEVPAVWADSDLAGLFDAEVFSSECGLMKPDAEIYLAATDALGVEPGDAMFVGDGANDELAGAARVGMTPVLFDPTGEPRWKWVADWTGLRIRALDEVLQLV